MVLADQPGQREAESDGHRIRRRESSGTHIREVMSPYPRALNPDATVLEAAEVMRRDDIGDVLMMTDADPAGVAVRRLT
jgi:CBS domain-containing protein